MEGTKMIGAVIRGEEEAKKWYIGPMNSKESSRFLGISINKLRKLVKEDKIPYSKISNKVLFHETILNAWKRGEFVPGKVELILDEQTIDFDYEDALKEHYERYPDLLEKFKGQEELMSTNESYDYKFVPRKDGVILTLGSSEKNVAFQVFLSNKVIDGLIQTVQEYQSRNKY
jgi:hypothetical protein